MSMKIHTIQVGKAKSNCYIISNQKSDALIIDPGDNPSSIIEYLKLSEITPLAILSTHAHFDHVSAVTDIKRKYEIPFFLHKDEMKLLSQLNMYRHFIAKESFVEVPAVDVELFGGENLQIGDFKITVLHTGVHTLGHSCFLIENVIFTGDILYSGKLDGTINKDKFVEKYRKAINSILLLPETTNIFPGHGRSSSIAVELKTNQELKELLQYECNHKTNCL